MAITTHDDRVGTLLGDKYRLGSIIGRGGMGAIFQGRHVLTGRPVAVKILNHEHLENPDSVRRFLREARVVAELKHPHIVDVLDMGEDADHTAFIVLELLEGEALSSVLHREGPLPFAQTADVLVPVMRALAYAHARGVVHRDLKPENIFVHRDTTGRVVPKLLDFGIAKALAETPESRITQTGLVMGTPTYMSPEQCDGISDRVGPAADVWSMGVSWYEALTGAVPFEGPTPMATLLAVHYADYTSIAQKLPDLPEAVAAVIDRALARDTSHRFPHMGAFLAALEVAVMSDPRPTVPASRAASDPPPRPTTLTPSLRPHELSDEHDVPPAPPRPAAHAQRPSLLLAAAVMLCAGALSAILFVRSGPLATPPAQASASPPITAVHQAATPLKEARPAPVETTRPVVLASTPDAPRIERAGVGRRVFLAGAQCVPVVAPTRAPRAPSTARQRVSDSTSPPRAATRAAPARRALPSGHAPFTDYDLAL